MFEVNSREQYFTHSVESADVDVGVFVGYLDLTAETKSCPKVCFLLFYCVNANSGITILFSFPF